MQIGLTKIYNEVVDEPGGFMPGLGGAASFAGERTLDKAFASLGRLERVQILRSKRGERLHRVVSKG